jgi:hypothetical protein
MNKCPNYDNPECFEVFHECSEQKQWELYRNMRELYEQEKESNANNCRCCAMQIEDLKKEMSLDEAWYRQQIDDLHSSRR